MKREHTIAVICVVGLGAAGVLAYLASRQAGPVPITQFTELREGPLQEHLVTKEELGLANTPVRHSYPVQVAPNVTDAVNRGFAPLYRICDRQIMALPAEAAW